MAQEVNGAGARVFLSKDTQFYLTRYCGGYNENPKSDGQCGPTNGPQCSHCKKSFPPTEEAGAKQEEVVPYDPVCYETGTVDPDATLGDLLNLLSPMFAFHREHCPLFKKSIVDAINKILREKLSDRDLSINYTGGDVKIVYERYCFMNNYFTAEYKSLETNKGTVLITADGNLSFYYGRNSPFQNTADGVTLKDGVTWYLLFMWLSLW